MNEANMHILLVDDDEELGALVVRYMAARGFTIEVETDGLRGLQRACEGDYALLVLDVMLPSMDGFEVLRRLRASSRALLPVVMLTAHGDEVDRIVGLELGADDYLAKPFNPRELLARIRAILRRAGAEGPGVPQTLHAPQPPNAASPGKDTDSHLSGRWSEGDLVLDSGSRLVRCNQVEIELTATEFDLLQWLMRAAGRVVTRDDLAREVLGHRLLPFDRSLDLHVSKLRRKLGAKPNGRERIKTVRGVGYVLTKDET